MLTDICEYYVHIVKSKKYQTIALVLLESTSNKRWRPTYCRRSSAVHKKIRSCLKCSSFSFVSPFEQTSRSLPRQIKSFSLCCFSSDCLFWFFGIVLIPITRNWTSTCWKSASTQLDKEIFYFVFVFFCSWSDSGEPTRTSESTWISTIYKYFNCLAIQTTRCCLFATHSLHIPNQISTNAQTLFHFLSTPAWKYDGK